MRNANTASTATCLPVDAFDQQEAVGLLLLAPVRLELAAS
jgi:hypothetical protein